MRVFDTPPRPLPPPVDPLEKWERETIGDAARVHFPLRDIEDVRRGATILRELSNKLEAIARGRDKEFQALLKAKFELKAANARMKSKPRPSER